MADFKLALPIILAHEGNILTDIPGDNGGQTYAGISRKWWPKWKGWVIVDTRGLKNGEHLSELDPLVSEFYEVVFWKCLNGDAIESQAEIDSIVTFGVNTGVKTAIILAQRALGLPETGQIDDHMIDELNHKNDII